MKKYIAQPLKDIVFKYYLVSKVFHHLQVYSVLFGNVPYNMCKDQLIDISKSVRQVTGFRYCRYLDSFWPFFICIWQGHRQTQRLWLLWICRYINLFFDCGCLISSSLPFLKICNWNYWMMSNTQFTQKKKSTHNFTYQNPFFKDPFAWYCCKIPFP